MPKIRFKRRPISHSSKAWIKKFNRQLDRKAKVVRMSHRAIFKGRAYCFSQGPWYTTGWNKHGQYGPPRP